MAGASLLALMDDIASVLDDIALMSKLAAKKTAGVLGDDLALNAEQVMGVAAERELPVVWAVAKGSLRNKAILVPLAILLSTFMPVSITVLLVIGGLYLSYEGAEKVIEKLFHHEKSTASEQGAHPDTQPAMAEIRDGSYEARKVKGAIRTDFILSAEIIVLALGVVQERQEPLFSQVMILVIVAIAMTAGVYGVVAGIVKLDDLGMFLDKRSGGKGWLHVVGQKLIAFAPKLMKVLTFVGTIAMFCVGGGLIVHKIPMVHSVVEPVMMMFPHSLETLAEYVIGGVIGLIAGSVLVGVVKAFLKLRSA